MTFRADYNTCYHNAMETLKPGIYQHFKGNKYRVHGIVKHSETIEPFVLYEALYENPEGKMWIRPFAMFTENVTRDGKTFPRFKYVGETEN